MRLQFLLVPYDSGHREWRMGRGPAYLLRHGAGSTVRALGHEVDAEYVEPSGYHSANPPTSTEIATSFSLYREVAARARAARERGALPVILSGNCGATLGAVAAACATGRGSIGVVWLDAHGDFNTPDTTSTGFLDGMMLAALTGRCWRAIASSIPGFIPVADADVVLAGVRDLDPAEEVLIEESEVSVIRAHSIRSAGLATAIAPALERLQARTSRIHLHIDTDVLDAAEARANEFATDGGLTIAELAEVVRLVRTRFDIVSAAVTAYDPGADEGGGVVRAVAGALETLVEGQSK